MALPIENPMMAALLGATQSSAGPSDIASRTAEIQSLLDRLGIDNAAEVGDKLAARRSARRGQSNVSSIATGAGMLLGSLLAGSKGGANAAFGAAMPGVHALRSIADVNARGEAQDAEEYQAGLKNYFDAVTRLYDETRPAGITWVDMEVDDNKGGKTWKKVGLQPQADGTVKRYEGPVGTAPPASVGGGWQLVGDGSGGYKLVNVRPDAQGNPKAPIPMPGLEPKQTPEALAEKSKRDAERIKEHEQLNADYDAAGKLEAEKKALESTLKRFQEDQTHKEKGTWAYDEVKGPPTHIEVPAGAMGQMKTIENPALAVWRKWLETKGLLDSMYKDRIPRREKRLGVPPQQKTGNNFFKRK